MTDDIHKDFINATLGQDLYASKVKRDRLERECSHLKELVAVKDAQLARKSEIIASLKRKARTLIDRAWNRALDEAAQVITDGGSIEDIKALRRVER